MRSVLHILLISCWLVLWSTSHAFSPVVYPDVEVPSSQCGQHNPQHDQQLAAIIANITQQLPPPGCNYPQTCAEVLRCNSSASSGYYQIQAANGSAVRVYCDMEGTHCGGDGGWMRVAHLNMTDPSAQCPVDFRNETVNGKRFCIRDTSSGGCSSLLFQSHGLTYSRVCGYARGYQYKSADAFKPVTRSGNEPLSCNYVDGVSITYGTPPTHVWTYAVGVVENETSDDPVHSCPCNARPGTSAPLYVGTHYYCESGSLQPGWRTNDPLWDGMQCGGEEGPCCANDQLPWFNTTTPIPTIATITMRVCLDEHASNEDIGIEQFELFVQ